ncbi:hypothetical protein FRC01_014280, partial [Tulasnella sp. 417]
DSLPSPPPALRDASSPQSEAKWLIASQETQQTRGFTEAQEAVGRIQRLDYMVASPTLWGPSANGDDTDRLPYQALYPSGLSGLLDRPTAFILSPNIPQSRYPNQERDADVDAASSPQYPESRPPNERGDEERTLQMYGAQDAAAWQHGGTTVNGGPIAPPREPLN